MSSVYSKSLPLGFARDDNPTRLAAVELYLRYLSVVSPDLEDYAGFLGRLYTSRYRAMYP